MKHVWKTFSRVSPLSDINMPSFCLKPLPLCPVTIGGPAKKKISSFLLATFKYWKVTIRSPRSLFFLFSFFFSEQPWLQFFYTELFQPTDHFWGPPLWVDFWRYFLIYFKEVIVKSVRCSFWFILSWQHEEESAWWIGDQWWLVSLRDLYWDWCFSVFSLITSTVGSSAALEWMWIPSSCVMHSTHLGDGKASKET